MIKFCRNCGKELVTPTDKTCAGCGSSPVKSNAFCRSCGKATVPGTAACAVCGAPLRPISHGERAIAESKPRLTRAGKIVNLTIVAVAVIAYVVFSLPKAVTRPIQATASDIVQASTGYNAMPLQYISSTPAAIPTPNYVGEVIMPSYFDVNATQQLTIYAIYMNTGSGNETKATRSEDVTVNCTFKSSDTAVIEVTPDGLLSAMGYGTANVTVFYTAAPGSSNLSAASAGKVPVTFSVIVPVTVGHRGDELFNATYGIEGPFPT